MIQEHSIDGQTAAIDALDRITSDAFQLEGSVPCVVGKLEASCTLPFTSICDMNHIDQLYHQPASKVWRKSKAISGLNRKQAS